MIHVFINLEKHQINSKPWTPDSLCVTENTGNSISFRIAEESNETLGKEMQRERRWLPWVEKFAVFCINWREQQEIPTVADTKRFPLRFDPWRYSCKHKLMCWEEWKEEQSRLGPLPRLGWTWHLQQQQDDEKIVLWWGQWQEQLGREKPACWKTSMLDWRVDCRR